VIAIATLPVLLVAEEWKPTQAYRKMVNRIEALGKIQRLSSQKKLQRLEELDKTAREIEQKWRQTDVEVYARLTYEVCATMGSLDFGTHKNHYLAQSFAMRALEKADDIPLELECKLLGYVQDRMDVTGKPLKGEAWAVLRKKQAKLWLRACQRIEKTIDNNWDPNDMPSLNVVPPATTGLPPGVAPSAIKDPKLRAEYEAAIEANRKKAGDYSEQHRVRDLKKYFIPMAERFIIGAYIELPMAELEGLLEQNISDPNKRASILKAVEKKELPKIELPTTQPLEAKPTTRPSETPKQSNNVPVKI
jgi:hypothetical protein